MLRDVLAAHCCMLMPRKGAALLLGFIVSQLTLAPWYHKAEGAPLVLRSNSDPASSLADASDPTTEGRLRHFARSWTNRQIKFEHAKRVQGLGSHVWFASAPSRASLEENTASEKSSSAITMLELDPFNDRAITGPEMEIQGALVDDYLFEAYRRLSQKRDAAGDFTWKDPAAAEHFGLPLDRYVIGGMDPDFRELIYAAGKSMDAAGIKWSILSAFRDDWRQQIASGFKDEHSGFLPRRIAGCRWLWSRPLHRSMDDGRSRGCAVRLDRSDWPQIWTVTADTWCRSGSCGHSRRLACHCIQTPHGAIDGSHHSRG